MKAAFHSEGALYSIAEDVRISAFDVSISRSAVLVSRGKRNFQVEGLASKVLDCLKQRSLTPEQLEQTLREKHGEPLPEGRVAQILMRLEEVDLVHCHTPSKGPSGFQAPPRRRSSYFAVRIPLLPERILRPVTRRLSVIFSPIMWKLSLVLLVLQAIFLWDSGLRIWRAHLWPHGMILAGFIAANYLGLLMHELGHAAACSRFGVRHGPIGFAVYLIFPAFYTDVTQAWQLDRKQRMVVDAGGMYVSLLLASAALLLYFSTKMIVFAQLAYLYDVTVLWNLNPFIRMDGYWLLSDVLGVPQLMSANRQTTRWLYQVCAGSPPATKPQIFSLPDRLKRIYLAYYALFLLFMVYAAFRFYIRFGPFWLQTSLVLMHQIMLNYRSHGMSWGIFRDSFRLLAISIPVLGLVTYGIRYLLRMLVRLGSLFKNQWGLYSQNPGKIGSHL